MIKSIRFSKSLLAPIISLALVMAGPTLAAEQATTGRPAVKTLLDNQKVRVQEVRYRPGDVNKSLPRRDRVIHYLTDGTFLRTYPDGKTEKVEYKAGQVVFTAASESGRTNKNIGKSDVVFYSVQLK